MLLVKDKHVRQLDKNTYSIIFSIRTDYAKQMFSKAFSWCKPFGVQTVSVVKDFEDTVTLTVVGNKEFVIENIKKAVEILSDLQEKFRNIDKELANFSNAIDKVLSDTLEKRME